MTSKLDKVSVLSPILPKVSLAVCSRRVDI